MRLWGGGAAVTDGHDDTASATQALLSRAVELESTDHRGMWLEGVPLPTDSHWQALRGSDLCCSSNAAAQRAVHRGDVCSSNEGVSESSSESTDPASSLGLCLGAAEGTPLA